MHKCPEPLVSVLIAAYNAGEYLRPAVESILRQTYQNLEIWVVDDGSTDGSFDSLTDIFDPRLRLIGQSNRGKPATLNALLDRVGGDYYVLQDADDISRPDRIARQVEYLERHPETAGCFTGYDLIIGGRHLAPRFRAKGTEECAADIEILCMPGHDPTAMYRMSLVGNLRYEAALTQSEGHDYILRIGEQFPLSVLGECLYSYRVHLESITRRNPRDRLDLVREMLRRACERRGLDPERMLAHLLPNEGRLRARDHDNNLAAHFIESTIDQREFGAFWTAIYTAWSCWRLNPRDSHYYKAFLYALAPPALTRWFRRRRRQQVEQSRRAAGSCELRKEDVL